MIGRNYDTILKDSSTKTVVIGRCALQRVGLTSCVSDNIQASTLLVTKSPLINGIIDWYFNPFANKFFDTTPSPICSNILEPSQERALIEYIMLLENFDEGILIEGLKTYSFQHDGDYSKLYDMLDKIPLKKELLDYWINEAETDEDD